MVYIEHIKNSFKTQFRYRLNWWMKILGTVLSVFMQICVWKSLLMDHESVVSMEYMMGYILLSAMIQSLIMRGLIDKVNDEIRTGRIAMNMIKPMRFKWYVLCDTLGGSLFAFLFQYLPVTIVMTIVYDAYEVWKGLDFWFLFSVIVGVYLYFSLAYCFALTGFWWGQTGHAGRLLNDIVDLFSGRIVPILLFPEVLLDVSRCLPFQYIYYTPISMLLNSLTIQDKIYSIGVQMVWCIIFTVLGDYVEHKGMCKLQVQGG